MSFRMSTRKARAEPRIGLVPGHVGLDHGIVGQPRHVARRLVERERHEGLVHGAGDAQRHAGDADGIEALRGEGIERPAYRAARLGSSRVPENSSGTNTSLMA